MLSSSLPTNSPDSNFIPRKEFIRDQPNTPNSFSLLAISSSNAVRLYSFPSPVVSSFRRLFEFRQIISSFREDPAQNFCEFELDGKPWSSSKSVSTERLLVEILTVIYHHGYSFVSSLDYGREHDDRLALAFSKPLPFTTSRPDSPLPISNTSKSNLSDRSAGRRIPFALSFPSATFLRVIAPPLDSTPAILQAVRGSWPRGVVSEKKIGDNSFEFKLKGYKWFQEDTFATDSLRHILTLLSSLDTHAFSLVTSLSLTGRSRVKDLWIFTGPASSSVDEISLPDSPAPSLLNLNASHGDLKRSTDPTRSVNRLSRLKTQHRRLATDPARSPPVPTSPLAAHHPRAATDGIATMPDTSPSPTPPSSSSSPEPSTASNPLRKPAPRAQVPVSVHDADEARPEFRANLPSTVSEGVENMTGVGAGPLPSPRPPHMTDPLATPDIFYSTNPLGGAAPPQTVPVSAQDIEAIDRISLQEVPIVNQTHVPALSESPLASHPVHQLVALNQLASSSSGSRGTPGTPHEIMGPHVFTVRDSDFSSSTDRSSEIPIPIEWTGAARETMSPADRESMTPMFPGGWQPTPIEERHDLDLGGEGPLDIRLQQDKEPERSLHDVSERVASPTFSDPDGDPARKSEAGLVEMMAQTTSDPKGNEKNKAPEGGKGWVLINVEGQGTGNSAALSGPDPVVASPASLPPRRPSLEGLPTSTHPNASMSPAAKAIVIIDAIDNKNKTKTKDVVPEQSSSRVRRFFSLSKKDSKQTAEDLEKTKAKSKSKSTLGDKLRRIGTPEASRNDGNRRSIDG